MNEDTEEKQGCCRSLQRLVRLRHANAEAHPKACSKCGELEKTGRGKDRRCLWCNWPYPENTELQVWLKDALAELLNIRGSKMQPNEVAERRAQGGAE